MKNIVFVLRHDAKSRQTALWFMQKIVTSKEYSVLTCKDNTFIKIITTSPGVEQNLCLTNDWLLPEETISLLTKHVGHENAKEWFCILDFENLARSLHVVADSLPYLGSSLDVIFCVGYLEGNALDSHSFISVSGAVRRLVDWHNGQVMIVKSCVELSPFELHLVEFGHCQVVNSIDELDLDWPGWRGKVAVIDHIESRGHIFPAFSLECDDWNVLLQQKLPFTQEACHKMPLKTTDVGLLRRAVCGRTVEVLQEVDLRTLPFFLLDSWTLQLNVHHINSKVLVSYIQSLEQAGLLARLRFYPDSNQIPVCGNMNLSTAAWKDTIISDISSLQEPPEEQVTDDAVFVYFLLLPHCISASANSSSLSVIAQILLSPHEINRNIFSILEDETHIQRLTRRKSHDSCKDGNNSCEELILEEKDKFLVMLDLLQRNIQNAISEYQDDVANGGDASHKIFETATSVQAEIISAAFCECKNWQEFMLSRQQFEHRIKWIPEAVLDPSKFPEKLTMLATQTSRKMLHSFPSMESLTASSPLSAVVVDNKKSSVDFDVSDISQFFNHDGTIKAVSTCPVKLKGRGICRVNSQHDSKTLWPDSQIFRFHDVYYYNTDNDWGLEKRYTKARDRGFFQDTRSSFVSPLKKHQQTKSTSLVSPVRCLQRRSISAQQLMTSSKSDLLKRISPRKQIIQSVFKQPVSHSYSPRKLSHGQIPELSSYCGSDSLGSSDSRKFTPVLALRNSKRLSRSQSEDQTSLLHTRSSTRDPRKRSFTVIPNVPKVTNKHDKKLSALTDLSCLVRRSPRRSLGSLKVNTDSSVNMSRTEKHAGVSEGKANRSSSQTNSSSEGKANRSSSQTNSSSEGKANRSSSQTNSSSEGKANRSSSQTNSSSEGKANRSSSQTNSSSEGKANRSSSQTNSSSEGKANRSSSQTNSSSEGKANRSSSQTNSSSEGKANRSSSQTNSSSEGKANRSSSQTNSSSEVSSKMKRSERHKLKLKRIIDHVLREKGLQEKDMIYAACSRNLFNVSMVLLKTLTTSQNLTEEMKTVVYGQVTQIINLEKRRCGMAV